ANVSVDLTDAELARADAVMVLTDHSGIDWQHVLDSSPLVVDFRNVYAGTPRSNQLWKL
ncbi:MAG: hypothetical protein JWM25_1574, partial [Thermoleophilia bacterium]|nr:hypothetical protein [Thermoleophilia bacterium]